MKMKILALVLAVFCSSALTLAQESKIIDEVIIKINDDIITRSEFERKVDLIVKQLNTRFSPEQIETELPKIRKNAFNIMVNQRILQTVTDKRGWKMTEEYYQRMVDNLKQQTQAKNDQEFLKALQDNNMTLEDVREMANRQYMDGRLFSAEVASEIPNTESHIQEYYEENANDYLIAAKIRISQIIFPYSQENKDEVQANAEQALARIKSGEEFGVVYRSVTPQSAPDATGDIGRIDLSSLREEMTNAIENMKVAEVSDVIVTPNALLIVKLTEKEEEKIIPLEEIKNRVVNDMSEKVMLEGLDKIILKYKREFFIELKSDEFASLYDPKSSRTR